MKIAITGGTGFVGRHLGRRLIHEGHEVVLISRGVDKRDWRLVGNSRVTFYSIGVSDVNALSEVFKGCDAVAHCAGINREIGDQTYKRVHVDGTKRVIEAARATGVKKLMLLSFLRARPNCGSGYHESKWEAEELVRASGLNYTILKAGVIYGKGDHMLDHLSHAFHSFPVFGLVGLQDQKMRPVAVEDLVDILSASLIYGRLNRKTVSVMGPETLGLKDAVLRVAGVVGKTPIMIPMPVWFHYILGWCVERIMKIPLISIAQVRILSEGLVEAVPTFVELPEDLRPKTKFTTDQIRKGLPEAKGFSKADLRCCCSCM